MDTIEIRLAKQEDAQFIALLGRTIIQWTETFGHLFRDYKDPALIDYSSTFSVKAHLPL